MILDFSLQFSIVPLAASIAIFAKTMYIVISITKAISIFLISGSQLIHITISIFAKAIIKNNISSSTFAKAIAKSLFTEAIFISSSFTFSITISIFTKANTIDRNQKESGGRLRA